MAKSVLVALRIPIELKAEIEKLVNSGKYENFSQLVRLAIQKFLTLEGVKHE